MKITWWNSNLRSHAAQDHLFRPRLWADNGILILEARVTEKFSKIIMIPLSNRNKNNFLKMVQKDIHMKMNLEAIPVSKNKGWS